MDEMISNCCKVFQRLSLSDGEMEKEHALHETECLVDKTSLVDKSSVKQTQLHIVKARPVSQVSANDKDGDSNKDEDNDKGKDINKTATRRLQQQRRGRQQRQIQSRKYQPHKVPAD